MEPILHRRPPRPYLNWKLDFLLAFCFCNFVLLQGCLYLVKHDNDGIIKKHHAADNFMKNSPQNITKEKYIRDPISIAVSWDHLLQSKADACELIQDPKLAPLPVIFVALGRSGSSISWSTIAKIMGDANPEKAYEITGHIEKESDEFFNSIPDEFAETWPSDYICDLQHNFTTARAEEDGVSESDYEGNGIVGFQWKPYMNIASYGEKGIYGFQNIANRKIPVVYQTRNPINVRLSNMRHKQNNQTANRLSPHCAIGDDECLQRHFEASRKLEFLVGKKLMNWVKSTERIKQKVLDTFDDMHIEYVHVEYEKLYENTNKTVDEWAKIFRFLGMENKTVDSLTIEEVQSQYTMAKTSNKTHKDIMSNYDEVKKTLKGTKFYYLLDR